MARGPLPLITFLLVVAPLLSAAPAEQRETQGDAQRIVVRDVTVLHADERSIVFEYRPRFLAPRQITQGSTNYVLYDFLGSTALQGRGNEGAPDLRYHSVPLAFPGETGHQVRVVAADYEDIPGQTVAPVPMVKIKDEMVETGAYMTKPELYARNTMLPGPVAELLPPQHVRSLLLGQVRLFPVQFNPAAHTVRRYSRIVVEVAFGRKTTHAVRNQDEALFTNPLLNAPQAALWKVTPPATPSAAATPSVLASGPWYRLTVAEDGIYRLDAKFFSNAGINLSGVDPRTIKLYGNGGREVPEAVTAPRPADLVENAIYVEGEADGQFGPGDYVLFYGQGVRGWSYDRATRTLRHYINHYTETNVYWLTYGGAPGKRMTPQPSLPDAPTVIPDRFTDGAFVEEELVNLVRSGKDWYGQQIQNNSSFTHMLALPGIVSNDLLTYRGRFAGAAQGASVLLTVKDNGTVIGTAVVPGISVSSGDVADWGSFQAQGSSTVAAQGSRLNFAITSADPNAQGWIDWAEVIYPRSFSAVGDYLHFRGPDASGVAEYRLQQFTTLPLVFNVSDPANVRMISGVSGSYLFRAAETAGTMSDYIAAAPASWKTPAGVQAAQNQNLHGIAAGADFLILTTPEYMSAAQRLKAHREQPEFGGFTTTIIDVQQIYNEFAGGLPDITGIRDFLKFAYETWTPTPRFVLFLGQASYDYKGILGKRTSYVPTWQSPESLNDVYSYATDDFFAMFTPSSSAPSLILGRIPARSSTEADLVVDKIIRYDTAPARDVWKSRILFVGDDAYTSEGGEVGDRTMHSQQIEDLAEKYTPPEFEKRKIYIADYPTVYTVQGRRKPGAYQAIIDDINEGALLFDYAGHGNPVQLAHENIFNVQSSIPQLVNADRLSVFMLMTCNFSQFDDPARYSGGEYLMNKPDGAGIGVVSASRKVFALENEILNLKVFSFLFNRDVYGRLLVERPATALFLHKATDGNGVGDQKYVYLGDPTMQLQFPRGYASIDSINHQPVDSANGVPRTTPIYLQSLGHVRVSGTIRNQLDQVDSTFNGTATIAVNDVTRDRLIVNFYPGANWAYKAPGAPIYQGVNSVTNGRFSATFIVPKDVVFADSSARGRLVAYYSTGSSDGLAYTGNVSIQGIDTSAVNDRKGPAINVYLDNRSFRPGDLVSDKPVLYVDLADSSGINTSMTGIGHRIEAWVNGSAQSIDLTQAYVSKQDDYRQGTVTRQLTGLRPGKSTLRVRAWDSFNNSATTDTYFTVAAEDGLTITDVMNYPNPFKSQTEFTFRQNQTGLLNVKVRIYTVAGRLIQTLTAMAAGSSFIRIPWDGRDRDGDILANGVYLYKITVQTADGRFSSEALGKLSALR